MDYSTGGTADIAHFASQQPPNDLVGHFVLGSEHAALCLKIVALTNGKALPHKAEISWSPTLWNSWEIRGFGDRSNEINEGEMPSEILENRKFGSCGSY